MSIITIFLLSVGTYLLYKYRNIWVSKHWADKFENVLPNSPPFCFDCNKSSCHGCKAYADYAISPSKGIETFRLTS